MSVNDKSILFINYNKYTIAIYDVYNMGNWGVGYMGTLFYYFLSFVENISLFQKLKP